MAQAPVKKTKQQRFADIEKAREYLDKYTTVYFIENVELPNRSVQKLKSSFEGRTLFVKKTMFQKFFPVDLKESYFMMFSSNDIAEELKNFKYPAYLKEGEKVPETVIIKSGIIKDKLGEHLENTKTQGSNIILEEDFQVCNEGDVCTEKQAAILKILGYKFGQNSLNILAVKSAEELKVPINWKF